MRAQVRADVSADASATRRVGMAIFLGALAMMFAALLLAYAVVRAQAPLWPPPGAQRLPRLALGASTLLLVASSLALRAGQRSAGGSAVLWINGALVLGAGFLSAQSAIWRSLVARGLPPAAGLYGSVFFALSGIHAAHVLGGLIALAWARRRSASVLRAVAAYWDFVLGVWLILYATVCLV